MSSESKHLECYVLLGPVFNLLYVHIKHLNSRRQGCVLLSWDGTWLWRCRARAISLPAKGLRDHVPLLSFLQSYSRTECRERPWLSERHKETCIWPRTHRLHPTNVHSLYPIPEGKENPAGASVQVQPPEGSESVNTYSLHWFMCATAYLGQILMSFYVKYNGVPASHQTG